MCAATLCIIAAFCLGVVTFYVVQLVEDLDRQVLEIGPQVTRTLGSAQVASKQIGEAATNAADSLENAQHDIRDLADGVTSSMDMVATDTRRNLDILGGTQNEIRHIIKDPRFKAGVFGVLDNSNKLLEGAQDTLQLANGTLEQGSDTLKATATSLSQANSLFSDADPFVKNMGKITDDSYAVEHKYFFPPKQKMTVAGTLWKAFRVGSQVAVPLGESLYYWTNIK